MGWISETNAVSILFGNRADALWKERDDIENTAFRTLHGSFWKVGKRKVSGDMNICLVPVVRNAGEREPEFSRTTEYRAETMDAGSGEPVHLNTGKPAKCEKT